MDATETAPNINALAHDDVQHENSSEAYAALKQAVQEYLSLIEQLHNNSHADNAAGVDVKGVDARFAALDEAHRTWLATSGVKIKPI